jgi:endoglucanase
VSVAAWSGDSDIKLNALGFLPDMPKKASITAVCTDFAVRNAADKSVVYAGTVSGPVHQPDINQEVWTADFSQVRTPGIYRLDIPQVGCSPEFKIDNAVYNEAYYAVMRGFYLWRCGCAVEGTHNGIHYAHQACHLDDGWQDYIGQKDSRRDGTGGWHDAGDFGKYTVNAGVTMGVLFMAWDHYQNRLKAIRLNLPETAPGYPDFLKELKWETDWLLKMQYPDGSGRVSHKLTRQHFSGFVMPETDKEKRYFTDWSSAAAADFTAIMAMAARYFEPYDPNYAKTCLEAALRSYDFLTKNLDDKKPDLKDFTTGGYGTGDSDDRLWAAAELWQTTGAPACLDDFQNRARQQRRLIEPDWDWGNVANLGMFTYLTSDRQGRDRPLTEDIRKMLLETADGIVEQAQTDVYARPLGGRYYWGCNGTVARQTVILMTAYKLKPKPSYRHASLDALSHLFGRNYYGRSFVTGVGHLPPMHPHDRRSGADGIDEPWPGYLVGGGQTATNWKDRQEDYRTNEIAVNWQAALVYALAAFTAEPTRLDP